MKRPLLLLSFAVLSLSLALSLPGFAQAPALPDSAEAARLRLETGFFKPVKFTYGEGRAQRVFNFTGLSFQPEFEDVLRRHPAAYREAKRSHLYNGIALGGLVVMDLYLLSGLLSPDGEFNLGPILLGGGAAIFSGLRSKAHLKKGVRLFNERQAQPPQPVVADAGQQPAFLGEPSTGRATLRDDESEMDGKNKLESWYTHWGLGYANISYPSPLNRQLEVLAEQDGVSHASVSVDLFGFYWPLSEQTILGGTANAFGDAYAVDGETLSIGGATIAVSAMHFVMDRIGSGFFVRADAGPSSLRVERSDGFRTVSVDSNTGFGWLAGGGYGLPVSAGTRLLLHVNYASRQIDGETFSNWAISVSGLF